MELQISAQPVSTPISPNQDSVLLNYIFPHIAVNPTFESTCITSWFWHLFPNTSCCV